MPKRSPILEVPFYLCIHPLTQNYQIWHGNTWGGGFLEVNHAPIPRGGVPALPNFGGSFLFMRTPLVAELPNLTGNICGDGVYHRVSHASHFKRTQFQVSEILGVLLYLCLRPWRRTTKFGVVTQGEGHVLGQSRHCICTNASRGLSATAEFLVYMHASQFIVSCTCNTCTVRSRCWSWGHIPSLYPFPLPSLIPPHFPFPSLLSFPPTPFYRPLPCRLISPSSVLPFPFLSSFSPAFSLV